MISKSKFWKVVGCLLFLLLAYFPLFLHLDSYPFKIWDESLFAMRAYHIAVEGSMLENFNYFSHIMEHANLKPPLGSVFQAISFRILGYNELALRLPIALFALGTAVLMIRFGKQVLNSYLPGAMGALMLFTSTGYICPHVARTGDQDVMLAFWAFAGIYAFYLFVQNDLYKARYLWILFACLLAGFMTKTVLVFFFLPGMFCYLIIRRQLKAVLNVPQVYFAVGSMALIVVGYYLLMNHYFEGFWKHVSEFVLSRYVGERNDQGQYFYYYFKQFATAEFLPWIALLPLNLWLYRQTKEDAFRSVSLLLWFCLLSKLLLVSFSATRMSWYEAAAYPPAAMLGGVTLHRLFKIRLYRWIAIAIALLAFSWAYYRIVNEVMHYSLHQPSEKIAYLMKKVKREKPGLKRYTIYSQPYNGQVAFYRKMLNDQHDYDISVMTYWQDTLMQPGAHLMIFTPEQKARAAQDYKLKMVSAYEEVQLYELIK